jgi:general secretion pathway protein A
MKFSDFGFKENPFSITPDPRYLYLSRGHEESLAHLIYGTGPNGGFVQLTGEVGAGKTMLVRSLLEQKMDNVDIALVLNPRVSRRDFLATICDELGIAYQGPPYLLKELNDKLTQHLLTTYEAGRHTVLVVDEAQNLSPRVLEQVRLLTNLETARHKLLRIILVGQPELQQLLSRKDLRQVDQRITARYHLSPLGRGETAGYIRHRLAVAGMRDDLFTPAALYLIYLLTRGLPRKINTLCERTLLAIFTTGSRRVTGGLVWRAAREIKGRYRGGRVSRWVAMGLVLLATASAAWWSLTVLDRQTPEALARVQSLWSLAIEETREAMAQTHAAENALLPETAHETSGGILQVEEIALPKPAAMLASRELEVASPRFVSSRPTIRQRLFALWGKSVPAESTQDMCNEAREFGLRCQRGAADWDGLIRMNRPALLTLKEGDVQHQLLLLGISGGKLLIDDGDEEGWVQQSEISQLWKGGYVLFWRPATATIVGPGSSGEAVTWLRERLSMADRKPLPTIIGLDHFDGELKQRLQGFQGKHGLEVDGLAGSHTMIFLNNLQLPVGTPTIRRGE